MALDFLIMNNNGLLTAKLLFLRHISKESLLKLDVETPV
jgi:hypothetical protein